MLLAAVQCGSFPGLNTLHTHVALAYKTIETHEMKSPDCPISKPNRPSAILNVPHFAELDISAMIARIARAATASRGRVGLAGALSVLYNIYIVHNNNI